MTARVLYRAAAVALAAALTVGATGCSPARTDATQQAIRYAGGSLDVETFKSCQPDPDLDYGDPGDQVYYYPSAQRTFSFTDDPNARTETGPLSVTTADSQQVIVRGFVTFTLTKECQNLRAFHERIGKRMNASFPEGEQEDDDGGWNAFLAQYFTNPVNAIADSTGVKYPWRKLYTDPALTTAFEQAVKDQLAAEINRQIGEGVITINGVDIQRPEPTAELLDSLRKGEQAKADGDARVAAVEADRRVAQEQTKLAQEQARTAAQWKAVYTTQQCMVLDLAKQDQLKNYNPSGRLVVQQAP